jgi:hypothetical protein
MYKGKNMDIGRGTHLAHPFGRKNLEGTEIRILGEELTWEMETYSGSSGNATDASQCTKERIWILGEELTWLIHLEERIWREPRYGYWERNSPGPSIWKRARGTAWKEKRSRQGNRDMDIGRGTHLVHPFGRGPEGLPLREETTKLQVRRQRIQRSFKLLLNKLVR